MHDEKTRDLPGLLVEPAKATITKIQVIKEPMPHISSRDPEEEDNKANQGQPGFKQIPSNFRIARPFTSSPLAVVEETRSCNRGLLWPWLQSRLGPGGSTGQNSQSPRQETIIP